MSACGRCGQAVCGLSKARWARLRVHGYHRALAARLGYKRAILATAHKLLRVIHAVLRDDRPYTDPGVDYEHLVVARNAPRWMRMLTKHGFLDEAKAVRS